jgi:threonine/homoserine/homoserine lactone efflux protein
MIKKYLIITLFIFVAVTSMFMYLMISENMEAFITQFKWYLRITSPFFMIYLIYIGSKK